MLFAGIARFRPGAEAGREKAHEAFSDHIGQPGLHVRLVGSLRDDDGARIGVLFFMEADSLDQVRRFVDSSPYTHAGLYGEIDINALDIEAGSLG